jgi:type II secretory pathway component PulF
LQVYRWQARQHNGRIVKGRLKANNPREVALHIKARYGYVTSIKETWTLEQLWLGHRARALDLREKEFFFRQLGILLNSGVNILRALDLIAVQASESITQVGKAIQKDLENGLSFSFSVRKRPKDFPPLVARLVEAGEASGNLAFLFTQLAQYYNEEREVRKTIATACLYPVLVLMCVAFTVSYFLFKVLPVILELYATLDIEILGSFQALSFLIQGCRDYPYRLVLFLGLVAVIAYYYWEKIQGAFLQLPYIRNLYHAIWEARYCRILALLLTSGIPLVQGLQIITPLLPTETLRRVSLSISNAVLRGRSLSKAATLYPGIFHSLSMEFIGLGEENGGLAAMLKEAAEILEEEVALKLKRMKILLEPLLVLLLTAFIGGIFYFLLTPIYGLITGLPNY